MPLCHCIDLENAIVHVESSGAVTHPERLTAIQAWLADPRYRPGQDFCCDFTKSTSVPTLEELQEIVSLFIGRPKGSERTRMAVITTRTVAIGAARQFYGILDDDLLEMKLFADRSSAMGWLRPDSARSA